MDEALGENLEVASGKSCAPLVLGTKQMTVQLLRRLDSKLLYL